MNGKENRDGIIYFDGEFAESEAGRVPGCGGPGEPGDAVGVSSGCAGGAMAGSSGSDDAPGAAAGASSVAGRWLRRVLMLLGGVTMTAYPAASELGELVLLCGGLLLVALTLCDILLGSGAE